jgi:hypothetical protein
MHSKARSGRKLISRQNPRLRPRILARDTTLIKGLDPRAPVAAIESGRGKSITDLAEQEDVTDAYICRLLPLTCLASDILSS